MMVRRVVCGTVSLSRSRAPFPVLALSASCSAPPPPPYSSVSPSVSPPSYPRSFTWVPAVPPPPLLSSREGTTGMDLETFVLEVAQAEARIWTMLAFDLQVGSTASPP